MALVFPGLVQPDMKTACIVDISAKIEHLMV